MHPVGTEGLKADDHVYVVGDFAFRNGKPAEWYLRQLRGHKHLIIGNHDHALLENPLAVAYFESIDKMMHLSFGGVEQDETRQLADLWAYP